MSTLQPRNPKPFSDAGADAPVPQAPELILQGMTVGLTLGTQAYGMWLGALSGFAEVSRQLLDEIKTERVPEPLGASVPVSDAGASVTNMVEPTDASPVTKPVEVARVARVAAKTKPAAATKPAKRSSESTDLRIVRSADDLKAISGIGPKLERVLSGMGIASYADIAALSSKRIAEIEEMFGFAG